MSIILFYNFLLNYCKIYPKEKEGESMQKVWELYEIAVKIIEKLCQNKCSHLTVIDIVEEFQDYIKNRLVNNEFKELEKYDPNHKSRATANTYLHTLISSRLIDFFNSTKHQRELLVMDSIREVEDVQSEPNDYDKILDGVISELSFEEQTYLKYRFKDELSFKQIGKIFNITHKQASKKIENIKIKLRKKLEKLNYSLEDIL